MGPGVASGDEDDSGWLARWNRWWSFVPSQKGTAFVSTSDVFKEMFALSRPNTVWMVVGFVALVRLLHSVLVQTRPSSRLL
jgi:hypothetical protein